MKKLRTPLIKPREQGGTFYTFGSALEDIGLNINELEYKVAMSHYVILNIPTWENDAPDKDPNISLAESFQNYALNLETCIRNGNNYNFAERLTVSERVFWKWLKHKFNFNVTDVSTGYFTGDSNIVKGFGAISAGAQRTDSYGIYNETYVQIPSSYKLTPVYFKEVNDYNYRVGNTWQAGTAIENISADELDNNVIKQTGLSGVSETDNSQNGYSVGARENLCVEFDLANLANIYGIENITYDDIATMSNLDDTYKFNAILVYYSIYNESGEAVATNAYGLLLLNPASADGTLCSFPDIEKKASNSTTTGNSYAFRLNIKTSSAYSTNITVNDNSTTGFESTLNYNDMIRNLGDAVKILSANNELISRLVSSNMVLQDMVVQAVDKIDRLEETLAGRNGIKSRLTAVEKNPPTPGPGGDESYPYWKGLQESTENE